MQFLHYYSPGLA